MPRSSEQFDYGEHIPQANLLQEKLGRLAEIATNIAGVKLENQHHATEAINLIEKGCPVIVFFIPHTTTQDPLPLAHVVQDYLLFSQNNARTAFMSSVKFTGEMKVAGNVGLGGIFSHFGKGWGSVREIAFFPVVQNYILSKLSDEDLRIADRLNRNAIRNCLQFLKEDSAPRVLMISAEATRNPLPGIIRANKGISLLMKKTGAVAVPVYMRNPSSMLPNPLTANITLGFCPPIDYQQIVEMSQNLEWNHDAPTLRDIKDKEVKPGVTMFGNDENFTPDDALHLHAVLNANLQVLSPEMHPSGIYYPGNVIPKVANRVPASA